MTEPADDGRIDMMALSKLLAEAATLPANQNGMVISLNGVLSMGGRALNAMAAPLDETLDAAELRADFDDRLVSEQPGLHAHSLEQLARHLEMLRVAIQAGDASMVAQFFNLYVFH